jgi:thiosulfate reductase cytochrome b subunit
MARKPRPPQPLIIRVTHWINIPVLVVMAMSGLQILRSYPYFGPQGAKYDWVPLQAWESPEWVRAGGWLAGARHLHFAFAWVLVINACVYLGYLLYTREWKRRWFWPPRDIKQAIPQALYYGKRLTPPLVVAIAVEYVLAQVMDSGPTLLIAFFIVFGVANWGFSKLLERRGKTIAEPAKQGLYNGLQRIAYTSAAVLGALEILSGLAIWKPVQLHRLAWLMGGYDAARVIHFLALLGLAGFVIMHVVMVVVHLRQFPEMVTGGALEVAIAEPMPAAPAVAKPTDAEPKDAPKADQKETP